MPTPSTESFSPQPDPQVKRQANTRTARAAWAIALLLLPLVAAALLLSPPNANGIALSSLGAATAETLGRIVQSPLFWLAVAVGFAAQAIDGALGMAYGISSTTFLMGLGATPAAASAAVHVAEVFTTGLSGAAHWRLGNVDRVLFRRIVVPGVLGSVAGAYMLTRIDSAAI
ncbi:MAG: sulfite exporter TauE/SafE family protein, partial [Hydrogenophaga sp.]